MQLNRQ